MQLDFGMSVYAHDVVCGLPADCLIFLLVVKGSLYKLKGISYKGK